VALLAGIPTTCNRIFGILYFRKLLVFPTPLSSLAVVPY
jgi:hypothetical protein